MCDRRVEHCSVPRINVSFAEHIRYVSERQYQLGFLRTNVDNYSVTCLAVTGSRTAVAMSVERPVAHCSTVRASYIYPQPCTCPGGWSTSKARANCGAVDLNLEPETSLRGSRGGSCNLTQPTTSSLRRSLVVTLRRHPLHGRTGSQMRTAISLYGASLSLNHVLPSPSCAHTRL